jgi:hypothetical protein
MKLDSKLNGRAAKAATTTRNSQPQAPIAGPGVCFDVLFDSGKGWRLIREGYEPGGQLYSSTDLGACNGSDMPCSFDLVPITASKAAARILQHLFADPHDPQGIELTSLPEELFASLVQSTPDGLMIRSD